jgi:hypothetical protein
MLTLLQLRKKILAFILEIPFKYSLSWALKLSNKLEWEGRDKQQTVVIDYKGMLIVVKSPQFSIEDATCQT